MSDYLRALVARTLRPMDSIRPRVPARFEPSELEEPSPRPQVDDPVLSAAAPPRFDTAPPSVASDGAPDDAASGAPPAPADAPSTRGGPVTAQAPVGLPLAPPLSQPPPPPARRPAGSTISTGHEQPTGPAPAGAAIAAASTPPTRRPAAAPAAPGPSPVTGGEAGAIRSGAPQPPASGAPPQAEPGRPSAERGRSPGPAPSPALRGASTEMASELAPGDRTPLSPAPGEAPVRDYEPTGRPAPSIGGPPAPGRPVARAAPAAPAEPVPTVRVTIGRVLVQAVTPPAPSARPPEPRRPEVSLEEYLQRRDAGRR